jgi:hypothetical protein
MKVETLFEFLKEIDPNETVEIHGACLVTDTSIIRINDIDRSKKTKQKTKQSALTALKRGYIAMILIGFALFSCMPTLRSYEIKRAEDLCKDHMGVHQINTILFMSVTCNDGSFFNVRTRKSH